MLCQASEKLRLEKEKVRSDGCDEMLKGARKVHGLCNERLYLNDHCLKLTLRKNIVIEIIKSIASEKVVGRKFIDLTCVLDRCGIE